MAPQGAIRSTSGALLVRGSRPLAPSRCKSFFFSMADKGLPRDPQAGPVSTCWQQRSDVVVRTRKNARPETRSISLLLTERRSLLARLAVLNQASSLRERRDLSGDNTPTSDALDTVQEAMANEEELGTREALMERLKLLVRAEEKMREGAYGICEACGEPIPPARLRAVPEATLCVPCADQEERRTPRIR